MAKVCTNCGVKSNMLRYTAQETLAGVVAMGEDGELETTEKPRITNFNIVFSCGNCGAGLTQSYTEAKRFIHKQQ